MIVIYKDPKKGNAPIMKVNNIKEKDILIQVVNLNSYNISSLEAFLSFMEIQ